MQTLKIEFINWINKHYPKRIIENPPDDFDSTKEIYFSFDHGETQQGPILFKDIPKMTFLFSQFFHLLNNICKIRTIIFKLFI